MFMWIFDAEPKVRKIFQKLEEKYFFFNEIEEPLWAIEKYIKSSKNSLIDQLDKIIKEEDRRVEYEEKNYPKDDITWPIPDYFSSIEIKNMYYESIFIFLFSFLERKMKNLNDVTEKKYKKKNSEGYLFEFRTNLELSWINFQHMEKEWSDIIRYNDLRNCLVHSWKLTKNKTQSITWIEYLNFTETEKETFVTIEDQELLKSFIKIINIFLNKLYYE